MEQTGLVLGLEGNIAKIMIVRGSMCGESCQSCKTNCGDEAGKMTLDIKIEDKNIEVGDRVNIIGSTKRVLMSTLIAYGIPLVLMLAGIIGSLEIFNNNGVANYEAWALLVGAFSLLVSFFIIRFIGDKYSSNNETFRVEKLD